LNNSMEGKPCGQKSSHEIAAVSESDHAASLHFCSHDEAWRQTY